MTSKLPWTTAAILLVAAVAVGAWAIWGATPAEPTTPTPPPTGEWNSVASGTPGPFAVWGTPPDNSGIENIYIVREGQTYTENFNGLSTDDNLWGTITSSGATFSTMTYDSNFAIVVAVTGHTDNIGQTALAYLKVALGAYTDSGTWTITYENSDDDSTVDEYSFGSSATTIRANVVWDNDANYYQLRADDNLYMENIDLWLRG